LNGYPKMEWFCPKNSWSLKSEEAQKCMYDYGELKKIKMDAVEEVHKIRERLASYSSERIQELAMEAQRNLRNALNSPR